MITIDFTINRNYFDNVIQISPVSSNLGDGNARLAPDIKGTVETAKVQGYPSPTLPA